MCNIYIYIYIYKGIYIYIYIYTQIIYTYLAELVEDGRQRVRGEVGDVAGEVVVRVHDRRLPVLLGVAEDLDGLHVDGRVARAHPSPVHGSRQCLVVAERELPEFLDVTNSYNI